MSDGAARPPLHFPPEPLTDGTVRLDALTEDDVDRVVLGCTDADTQLWLPLPYPYGEVEARTFIAGRVRSAEVGEELALAIRGAGEDVLAGCVGLHQRGRPGELEIGYWMAPDRRRRGWTACAVRLMAGYAFDRFTPRRIEILVDPANRASQGVAKAAGATAEGLRRNGLPPDGGDALVFSFIPDDLDA